MQFCQVDTTKC